MASKNSLKIAVGLEKTRSDAFPPSGVPLCTLALKIATFGR